MQLNGATLWLSHMMLVYARKDWTVPSDVRENGMLKATRIIGGEAVSATNDT